MPKLRGSRFASHGGSWYESDRKFFSILQSQPFQILDFINPSTHQCSQNARFSNPGMDGGCGNNGYSWPHKSGYRSPCRIPILWSRHGLRLQIHQPKPRVRVIYHQHYHLSHLSNNVNTLSSMRYTAVREYSFLVHRTTSIPRSAISPNIKTTPLHLVMPPSMQTSMHSLKNQENFPQ